MIRHVTPARITIFRVRNKGRHSAASLPSQYLHGKRGLYTSSRSPCTTETPCLKIQISVYTQISTQKHTQIVVVTQGNSNSYIITKNIN